MTLYTQAEVDAMLARLRGRIADTLKTGSEVCYDMGADFPGSALRGASMHVHLAPLHAPDEPAPTIAWGPPPTLDEAKANPVWLCLAPGDKYPETRDLRHIARGNGDGYRRHIRICYDGFRFIPLDSDGLPCARPAVTEPRRLSEHNLDRMAGRDPVMCRERGGPPDSGSCARCSFRVECATRPLPL